MIDAAGKWIVPGFLDVHTHYDAEVLLDPGLRESVRHGVTTVLLGNCSLSTVYANSEDAADLFSRVEAVPRKYVFGALNAEQEHGRRPRNTSRRSTPCRSGRMLARCLVIRTCGPRYSDSNAPPTPPSGPPTPSCEKMAALLDEALDAGMLGMSGMDAAIDKLDGDRFRSRALPSTFATWRERRKLIKVLRKRGRMLQSAPDVENPVSALMFFLSSSRMFGAARESG